MTAWVYKIIRTDSQECIYVGHTSGKYFCQRKCDHQKPSNQNNPTHQNLYGYIKNNGGWTCFEFKIESEHETKQQAYDREKEIIQLLLPICNIHHKKTAEEKKLQRNLHHKEYLNNNPIQKAKQKERIKKRDEIRSATHIDCPCGGTYTLQNKTNHYKRDIHRQYETYLQREES